MTHLQNLETREKISKSMLAKYASGELKIWNVGKHYDTKPKVIKQCKVCKKDYEPDFYRSIDAGYCSLQCFWNRGKLRIKFNCIQCGKEDEVMPSQYKHYKNAGRFCSNKCRQEFAIGKMPSNVTMEGGGYPHIQRGDYENSKGTMYFRSKWEANYALYLDFLLKQGEIKNWEYEIDVFIFDKIKFGTRSYRPDFKVFNNNGSIEYHEVKGYMDGKSKTKLKRMAKYYPNIKLILIDSKYYRELEKKIGKALHFY